MKHSHLYLKNIFDSMPSILIGVDSDGKVTQWNMEAEKVTQLSEKEACGNSIEKLMPQFSAYLQNIHEAIKEKRPRKFEKVGYTVKGKTRLYDIVVYPLIANGIQGAVIRVDDITSRVQFEEMMIQSEKMASLGELTAGIAHEIQNPLNFVNNFSEVNTELISELIDEMDKGNTAEIKSIATDIRENSEKIVHHGKRADAIVKGMLQHSRSSSGVKEPTDINALTDEYLRLAYHGLRAKDKSFNATMKTEFDESIGNIKGMLLDMYI